MGGKNRSQGCIFSLKTGTPFKGVHPTTGGTDPVGISRGLFWGVHPPPNLDGGYERFRKKLAQARANRVRLFGRYTPFRPFQKESPKGFGFGTGHPVPRGVQGEPEKVNFGAMSISSPLGVPYRLGKGGVKGTPHKLKAIRKDLGKILVAQK